MCIGNLTRDMNMAATMCSLFVVSILNCVEVWGQTQCDEPIRCGEQFAFVSECLEVKDGQYSYPFLVSCEVVDPGEPILEIVKEAEVGGNLVTTTRELQSILGLTVGRHCGLKLFDLRNLTAKVFLVGNPQNPIVLQGALGPSWCLQFDGRDITIESIAMNYTLRKAPPLIGSILNDNAVRSLVDEEVSSIVEGTSFDILNLLRLAN